MGNPSYGAGYYQGSEDGYGTGFGEGFERGAGAGTVGVIAFAAVIISAKRGFEKYKKYRIEKYSEDLPTDAEVRNGSARGWG